MRGWHERNFECADALVGDGRLMTSASVARSVAADWGEYPGLVCARSGRASTSVSVSASLLFISLRIPVFLGLVPLKGQFLFVKLFESDRDGFTKSGFALRSRSNAASE